MYVCIVFLTWFSSPEICSTWSYLLMIMFNVFLFDWPSPSFQVFLLDWFWGYNLLAKIFPLFWTFAFSLLTVIGRLSCKGLRFPNSCICLFDSFIWPLILLNSKILYFFPQAFLLFCISLLVSYLVAVGSWVVDHNHHHHYCFVVSFMYLLKWVCFDFLFLRPYWVVWFPWLRGIFAWS